MWVMSTNRESAWSAGPVRRTIIVMEPAEILTRDRVLLRRCRAADFLATCESNWTSGEGYAYLITTGGRPVGVGGLDRDIGPGGLEVGCWLHPDHTGRGIATTATALLVEHAFTVPGIHRVQLWHDAANTASAGIARRLCFTELDRRTPPRAPLTSGERGIDVVWQKVSSP